MQTPGVAQCLKLISRKGCEKIVPLAFELAITEGRRQVHCATKANIMKLTEGLLKRTFEGVAREYPTSRRSTSSSTTALISSSRGPSSSTSL